MPELPEVESLRKFLNTRVVGLDISRVELSAFSALKTFDPALSDLVGRRIGGVNRRGKYLIFETVCENEEPFFMVIHLARGGWLKWMEELTAVKAKPGKGPMALRVGLSDGSGMNITEAGTEKRLAIWVVRDIEAIEFVHTLGPDPLDPETTIAQIAALLRGNKGQVKRVLTDQRVLAGVGNAYSDEALHAAKMSPFKAADKMTEAESETLAQAVVDVLSAAVVRSADTPVSGLKSEKKSGLQVHGRNGLPCPVCGDTVREVSYTSKSFQYCPTCQTGGKPLADRRMSRLLK